MKKSRLTPTRLNRLGLRWCPRCDTWQEARRATGRPFGCFNDLDADYCGACETEIAKEEHLRRRKEFDTNQATDGCDGSELAWGALSDGARQDQRLVVAFDGTLKRDR